MSRVIAHMRGIKSGINMLNRFNLLKVVELLPHIYECPTWYIMKLEEQLSTGQTPAFLAVAPGRKTMELYKNKGGGSEIWAYEIGENWITIQFTDASVYIYTYESAGTENVDKMKVLALSGHGLYRYIMRHVKNGFAKKLA